MLITQVYNSEGNSFPNCKIKFYELDKTNHISSKLPDIGVSGFEPEHMTIGYTWTNHESRYIHKLDWIRYLNKELESRYITIPLPPTGYGYPNYETLPGSDIYKDLHHLVLSIGFDDIDDVSPLEPEYMSFKELLGSEYIPWKQIDDVYGMYWALRVYPIEDLKRVEAEYERNILEWSDSDIEFAKTGYDVYGESTQPVTTSIDKSLPPVDPNFYGTFSDNVPEGVIPYQAATKAGGTNQRYIMGDFIAETTTPEVTVSPTSTTASDELEALRKELEECHRKISDQNKYITELERDTESYQNSYISIKSKAKVLIKCYHDRVALDKQIKSLEDDLTTDY